jgi:hypothetical protein
LKNLLTIISIFLLSSCALFRTIPEVVVPPPPPLPKVYIVSQPITSKDDYVKGVMQIGLLQDSADISKTTKAYLIQIKGRGNSTWAKPKNPYKIKLNDKDSVLGMPADKEWALLANYFDKSLLRNDIAFELANRLQMAYTPRRKFIDLYLNGEYNGNYLLTELIKISKDRVNITAMGKSDTTGGFIAEANWRQDEKQNWISRTGVRMSMKDPDSLSAKQFAYVQILFAEMEDGIQNYKDVRGIVDIDSWIKWTIVNEFMRNRDAVLFGSCFFYKDNTGKIAMGPVWDFDLSSGAYTGNVSTGWYLDQANWTGWLFTYHPYYKDRFKQIWNQYRKQIATMPLYIDSMVNVINSSQKANYEKWHTMESVLYTEQIVFPTYESQVANLKEFLRARFVWMDGEINK